MNTAHNRSTGLLVRQRTCIATRKKRLAADLLRIVARSDETTLVVRILPDPTATLPGRGAWITPTIAAVDEATKRGAFRRAFRLTGTRAIDTLALISYLSHRDGASA